MTISVVSLDVISDPKMTPRLIPLIGEKSMLFSQQKNNNSIIIVDQEKFLQTVALLTDEERALTADEENYQQESEYLNHSQQLVNSMLNNDEVSNLLIESLQHIENTLKLNGGFIFVLDNYEENIFKCICGTHTFQGMSGQKLSCDHGVLSRICDKKKIQLYDRINLPADIVQYDKAQTLNTLVIAPVIIGNDVVAIFGLAQNEKGVDGDMIETLSQILRLTSFSLHYNHLYLMACNDLHQKERVEHELKSAKQLADDTSRAKSAFFANMSHELRTPLNSIIGYSELLMEDLGDSALNDFLPDVNNVLEAGRHLLFLVNSILDFSKIEAQKTALFLEEFVLQGMLDSVVNIISPSCLKKGIELNTSFHHLPEKMLSDQTKLKQMLLNLLNNAIKFTETGEVIFEVFGDESEHEKQIHFLIRDSGIGMSEKQIEEIFNPFVQADYSTTRKFGGTGLGLAIVKSFCEMMGGHVNVKSVPGEGSTFNVLLPAQFSYSDVGMLPESRRYKDEGCSLLVISSSNELVEMLSQDLGGIQLENKLERSLKRAGIHKPLLIVVDCNINGDIQSFLMQLISDDTTSHIPVILIVDETKDIDDFT